MQTPFQDSNRTSASLGQARSVCVVDSEIASESGGAFSPGFLNPRALSHAVKYDNEAFDCHSDQALFRTSSNPLPQWYRVRKCVSPSATPIISAPRGPASLSPDYGGETANTWSGSNMGFALRDSCPLIVVARALSKGF
jgi:hypothetical protein